MTDRISLPAGVVGPREGVTLEELQLAARNHGLPLEALRYDLTPPGLHYLLTHYDIPAVDPASFRLIIDGLVDTPLTLDLDDLRSRPRRTVAVTMECAGNGRAWLHPRPVSQPWLEEAVGTARWTGTPLAPLLREAGMDPAAVDVVFTGLDHGIERGVEQDYQRSLSPTEALRADVLLAYEMNGAQLPPQHGHPLRLVVPGWYGMAQVKWLTRITPVAEAFDGFQMRAYALRQHPTDTGTRLTRMQPRALLIPPGFPDFMSRTRMLAAGSVTIEGRAWSGWAPVDAVDLSLDGGATWTRAELGAAASRWAWTRWTWSGDLPVGAHVLSARARDSTGRFQPVEQHWNLGGFANNTVQQVAVVVR